MAPLHKTLSAILRFDLSIQRADVKSAYGEFWDVWWTRCHGDNIPNVAVLCALAASCHGLPATVDKSKLCELWIRALQKLTQKEWKLFADDYTNAVTLFGLLPKSEALELMREAQRKLDGLPAPWLSFEAQVRKCARP